MHSTSFVKQKKVGRYFENLLDPVFIEMGFKVYDSDHLKYQDKKGWDKELEIKGVRSKVELKYDAMSEQTENVAIDLDSIGKSTAAIWIFGLPEGNLINTYSMLLSDLAPYALQWPIKRLGGEWASPIALIPKQTFTGLPFVQKFKTINLG
jgi:hypothetical protein